jgi:hypothetical protein
MKTYGEVDVQIHVFLTSALFGDEWSALRPRRFVPRKKPPVLTRWELGGSQSRYGRCGEEKILDPIRA